MPIFEYECRKCKARFEELVMSSSFEVTCPSCGSTDLEKLISAISKTCHGCGSAGGHT